MSRRAYTDVSGSIHLLAIDGIVLNGRIMCRQGLCHQDPARVARRGRMENPPWQKMVKQAPLWIGIRVCNSAMTPPGQSRPHPRHGLGQVWRRMSGAVVSKAEAGNRGVPAQARSWQIAQAGRPGLAISRAACFVAWLSPLSYSVFSFVPVFF